MVSCRFFLLLAEREGVPAEWESAPAEREGTPCGAGKSSWGSGEMSAQLTEEDLLSPTDAPGGGMATDDLCAQDG